MKCACNQKEVDPNQVIAYGCLSDEMTVTYQDIENRIFDYYCCSRGSRIPP
jgi:hypothetical protein